jgi:hypothetical protein
MRVLLGEQLFDTGNFNNAKLAGRSDRGDGGGVWRGGQHDLAVGEVEEILVGRETVPGRG